jgi:hypothetical protein
VFPNEERKIEQRDDRNLQGSEWSGTRKSLHKVRSKNAIASANASMDNTDRNIATENANLPNQRLTF